MHCNEILNSLYTHFNQQGKQSQDIYFSRVSKSLLVLIYNEIPLYCKCIVIYSPLASVTWHIFQKSSIHSSLQWAQDVADHKWKQTQCSRAVHQAELSDNRWDVECLSGLSTQEECGSACAYCTVHCVWWWTPAGEVLTTPYETCWRMITMGNDYHLVSPLSLRAPSLFFLCSSPLLSSLPFSTRGQVSLRLRCQGCQSPTQWVRGNCCQGNRAIWLLGTWSCAHNSHFVA